MSTPPRLRNLGIPCAKRPPSCGAAGALAAPSGFDGPSLLLRFLFALGTGGTGGAPVGGFLIVGIGGALATGGGPDALGPPPPTAGADLSLVTAFFRWVPFVISDNSAPFNDISQRREEVSMTKSIRCGMTRAYPIFHFSFRRSRGKITWRRGRRRRASPTTWRRRRGWRRRRHGIGIGRTVIAVEMKPSRLVATVKTVFLCT